MRLSQGAQPTDAVRFLLEKGGLLEKSVRPAETIGKLKQAAAREAAVKQDAKDAKEAKAAEAAAASESDDSATESTES